MFGKYIFSNRRILAVTVAFILSTFAGLPALATGGNDPIPGIDIIILKDPSSQPIKPFSFDGPELKKLNALQDAERPRFVLTTIAKRIGADKSFVKSGMEPLGKVWCATCTLPDDVKVKFRHDDASYTLGLTIHAAAAKRPTQLQRKAQALPQPDEPNPKAQTLPKR